ncbi:MAG: hypothetical protein WBN43_19725 [Thiogranum sp.]
MRITRTARRKAASLREIGLRFVALCALALSVCACSTPLHVDSAFPHPVVAGLPIGAGVYYDEPLRQYAFKKEADANSLAWNIEIGAAHVRLFDQLFQPVFENLVHVDGLRSGSGKRPVSIVIKPSIDEYTLHTPGETATEFYTVEIHYNLAFYSPSGEFIQRWSYFGRGRSRSELFSADESVQKATVAAMRDAAAWLIIELTKSPDLHTQIQAQQSDNANVPEDHES